MAQIGLKDTLTLLAKGYSKKEIDALASIDEKAAQEQEAPKETPAPVPEAKPKITPEIQAQMDELLSQIKEKEEQLAQITQAKDAAEAKVTKLQQDNVHSNSAPAAAEAKKEEQEALTNMVRSFM